MLVETKGDYSVKHKNFIDFLIHTIYTINRHPLDDVFDQICENNTLHDIWNNEDDDDDDDEEL